MKTLFYKDLRENFKLALIGAAVLTLILVLSFNSSMELMERIAEGQANNTDSLQPLLSESLLVELAFFCAIFGAAVGWLQTRNEAHRDLWAFLIHRPLTRTEIFWGKISAGLCLYLMGAGLPLLGVIWYARQPGHVAAPFEWAMTLPVTAVFLTGVAYYFAGQLTGLRQARWFGSKIFGLGAAISSSMAVLVLTEFWQALALIVAVTIIVGGAVWGAYQSGGFYQGQPWFAKLALAISLAFGSLAVLGLFIILLEALFQGQHAYIWRNYCMTRDGQVWIRTSRDGEQSVADLAGRPYLDPVTGRPAKGVKEFNAHNAYGTTVNAGPDQGWPWENRYGNAARYFTLCSISDKVLWYMDDQGKLTGYNSVTRRHVADLIPHNATGEDHFIHSDRWNYYSDYDPHEILATSHTIYRVDFEARELKPVLTTAENEPIAGYGEFRYGTNAIIVLTRSAIQLTDFDGNSLFSLPYQPDYVAYPSIELTRLQNSNSFAVWFQPSGDLNEKMGWKMPVRVLWLSPANAVAKTAQLPAIHEPNYEAPIEKVISPLTPPAVMIRLDDHRMRVESPLCLVTAGLCALVGWYFTRRYRFPGGAAVAWLLFIFALGIPGLMTFICAQDWPRREACPGCKKLRRVDREKCEHCHTDFAPPEKIGIEIFEPLKI